MKRFSFLLFSVVLGLAAVAGCDTLGGENTGGTVVLMGRVVNAEGLAVSGATVTAQSIGGAVLGTDGTDVKGNFDFSVEIDSTMQIFVIAQKGGRFSGERSQLAQAGGTIEFPELRIAGVNEEEPDPGTPAYIQLQSVTPQSIQVQATGGTEVANLTFVVRDSAGRPISLDFQAGVRFSLAVQPDGGERLTTRQDATNNNGEASVSLISGTKAGVVQVVAEIEGEGGDTLRSKPVAVTIHGGFPIDRNFDIYPAQFNHSVTNADAIPIGATVGDRYNNPVKVGTAVYFTTNGNGIIEGSILTDGQGRGSVNLYPTNAGVGDVITVRAETANRQGERIYARTGVFFSGIPQIEVAPAAAILNQTYQLTVTDQQGNPLAPGTTITVVAEGTQVQATGNTNVTLGDPGFDSNGDIRVGPGITEFTFRTAADPDPENPLPPVLETITITVSGPNGTIETALTPSGSNSSVVPITDGATVELRGSSAVIRAPRE